MRLGVVSEDVVEVMRGLRVDDEIVIGEKASTLGPGMRVQPVPRGTPPSHNTAAAAVDDRHPRSAP